jgi:hypothetical protein
MAKKILTDWVGLQQLTTDLMKTNKYGKDQPSDLVRIQCINDMPDELFVILTRSQAKRLNSTSIQDKYRHRAPGVAR